MSLNPSSPSEASSLPSSLLSSSTLLFVVEVKVGLGVGSKVRVGTGLELGLAVGRGVGAELFVALNVLFVAVGEGVVMPLLFW